MRILIINPNTSKNVTEKIKKYVSKYANKDTIIDAVSPETGPNLIEDYYGDALAAVGVLTEVKKGVKKRYDGFLLAAGCDTGLEAARQVAEVPVLGLFESGMLMAHMLGKKFAVLFPDRKWSPYFEDLIQKYGLKSRCVGIKVAEFSEHLWQVAREDYSKCDPKELLEGFAKVAKKAIQEDGAEVFVFGCTLALGLDKELEKEVGVPVIDGAVAGVKFLEALHGYGKKTSKIPYSYMIPAKKEMKGFPEILQP